MIKPRILPFSPLLRGFRWWLSRALPLGLSWLGAAVVHAASHEHSVSEKELEQALASYRSISQLDVKFKQNKVLKDMDMALVAEGQLELRLPETVVFTLSKPSRLVVTMTPEQIKIVEGQGGDEKTQILKANGTEGETEKRNLGAMVSWLKMDPKLLAKDYLISGDDNGGFRFRPRTLAGSPFTELQMQLSRAGQVSSLKMFEASGDRIEFKFETPKVVYLKSAPAPVTGAGPEHSANPGK